jgi:hypothetical protein
MQVLVNSDHTIHGGEDLTDRIEIVSVEEVQALERSEGRGR